MHWKFSTFLVFLVSACSVFGRSDVDKRRLLKEFLREKHEKFARENEINPARIDRMLEAERKNSVLYGNPHPIHKDDWIVEDTTKKRAKKQRKECNKICPKRYKCVRGIYGMERCVHKRHRKKSENGFISADRRTEYTPKHAIKTPGEHRVHKLETYPYHTIDDKGPVIPEEPQTSNDVINPRPKKADDTKVLSAGNQDDILNEIDDNSRYGELVGKEYIRPISDDTEGLRVEEEQPNEIPLWTERSHRSDIEINEADACSRADLEEIRRRLSGWFALIHARDKEHRRNLEKLRNSNSILDHRMKRDSINVVASTDDDQKASSCGCINSVMWLRKYLDKNKDGLLNHKELKIVEHNNNEQCLRPFIQSCDQDLNGYLTKDEWCCCFTDVLPPCFKQIREVMANLSTHRSQGMYIPRCTSEGYFEKEQCDRGSRECWCVDISGNEVVESRQRGTANCGRYDVMGQPIEAT